MRVRDRWGGAGTRNGEVDDLAAVAAVIAGAVAVAFVSVLGKTRYVVECTGVQIDTEQAE